jgi:murein tripeptide amidase MpaA
VYKLVAVLIAALAALTVADARQPSTQVKPAGRPSLAALYTGAGGAVRDTNGDALPDSVLARVIVPARPTPEDVEAAANIAARLGYETTALTLPLVLRDEEVRDEAAIGLPILVGRENAFVKRLAERQLIDLARLQAGQGIVQAVASPLGGPDGLVVAGGDDAGTLVAAVQLAARVPRLWSMTGITLPAIERQAAEYLQRKGIATTGASVVSLLVDAERRGIASIGVEIAVAAADGTRAAAALGDLDAAHRQGREERTLNFSEAAVTDVRLLAGGREVGRAGVRRAGLNGRTLTPPVDPDEFLPDPSPDRPPGAPDPRLAPAKPFDLSATYSLEGWFGDAYADLIPDRTESLIVVGGGSDTLGAAHIAARLGLETTGISLPITRRDHLVKEPGNEAGPVLVGRDNTHARQLIKIGKARLDDLAAGEGAVQIVPRAFGNATATVVAGSDDAGSLAASMYLARRAPYVWEVERGAPTLEDLATDASRFLQARSGAGQAGLALREVQEVVDSLKGKTIESFEARLFLEKGDQALDHYLAAQLTSTLGKTVAVKVASEGITDASTVFEEKVELPWEVDEFRTKLRQEVIPKVKAGSRVEVEARLSEAPELRAAIAAEARAELARAGAADPKVTILSAYKQGYSWVTERVIPELKGKNARAIRIKVAAHKPDLSKKFKFYSLPSRWLHELYPVDEIVQREAGIPVGAFRMELVEGAADIYSLEATGASGTVVYRSTFSPKYVEREYLDKFPGWSRVEVTTGWLRASVDGQVACDTRIETDPERFWNHYQGKVLPKVYDHVMKVTGGKPTADKQPFHRDLDIEVRMSEPDYRIAVDEEHISSLEALHEDLYFVTLDFFAAMGRTLTRNRLNAPGKIFPIIHPSRAGKPGEARILYAGNASTKAKIDFSYKEKGVEKPVQVSRDLARIDATAPMVVRAIARADRLSEIELQVEAKDDKEATRAVDALDGLVLLHAAGLYRKVLSFEHVDRLAFSVLLKDARTRRVVPNTGEAFPSSVRRAAGNPVLPIVTWDHIISPEESESLVAKLAAWPEVRSFKVGESYRGRDISAMEVTLPTPSELISPAKYTVLKPTLLMMGRQHANEVSSTSHILRLAELLATDPSYKEILKKVNFVLCPVMNPDGAAMAYELQKLTPTHMLHAGRYSAVGMDVSSRTGGLLPEAEVEGRLWRRWLPDIYLNPHGYPSHEWVQPFSGYVSPAFRAYWSSRGWYTMISGLRDPRYPDHADATAAIRDAVAREVSSNPDVRAMSLRHQARYHRWATGFGPHLFGTEIYRDTMIYYSDPESGEPRGSRRAAASAGTSRRASMSAWPQVTFMSGMTEAPDETAQSEWLTLVTKAGFSFLMAHVKYLQEGRYSVERIEEGGVRDGAVLTMLRVRPVKPALSPRAPTRVVAPVPTKPVAPGVSESRRRR